jgi:L-cysteine/cystine lyase
MERTFDLTQVRQNIPALDHCIYLNTGTFGPMPNAVKVEVNRITDLISEHGPFAPDCYEMMVDEMDRTRKTVAHVLNAPSCDNITLTRNTTEGANIVAWGIDWQPGDRILTSTHEHPSGFMPLRTVRDRFDLDLEEWEWPEGGDDALLEAFEDKLRERPTRFVYMSYVTCDVGRRLPIAQMVEIAHAHGALFMVDGAHAEGQIRVDVQALGCDFFTGCGHKWLGAPQGTGMLYMSPDVIGDMHRAWIGWTISGHVPDTGCSESCIGASFEFGTRPWILTSALRAAIEYQEGFGRDMLESVARENATWFKDRLRGYDGVSIQTPLEPARSTGLVRFTYDGVKVPDLRKYMWEEAGIVSASGNEGMRVSIAYYTTREELETLLEVWDSARA